MLLRCLHDSSSDPLRFMAAALPFTTLALQMLTMRPWFNTVLLRFKPGSATVASRPNRSAVVLYSWWIGWLRRNMGVSDTPIRPRTPTNDYEYNHGATRIDPDSATVELRFRPHPQSTTIHPDSFKRFKIVVVLSGRFPNQQDSSQFTMVLLWFTPMALRCYYESCQCILIWWIGVNRSSTGAKIVNV